jgi:hypothetical protein
MPRVREALASTQTRAAAAAGAAQGIPLALPGCARDGAPLDIAMPHDLENPSAHDPALSQNHAAGVRPPTVSPAERALAPEAEAPMQSANGRAADGTYVGQAGGYIAVSSPTLEDGVAQVDQSNRRGDGVYGFPAGPGVGMPGGEHRPIAHDPDNLPDQYTDR